MQLIVVGSGIVGASCAYAASSLGAEVVLVEAAKPGRAAAPEIGEVAGVSGADAQRLFPPLRADAAAVYIGGAARVDGRKLAAALARAAVRQGAVVRDGEALLARGCGRVAGVRLGGELIEGDAVVAAAGAWTRSFLQAVGLAVPVEPQRGQMLRHSHPERSLVHTGPAVLRSRESP